MEPTIDEALLTAYLDGELTPHDRQFLEQRLVNEPELRQRLTLLEEIRYCLDLLEQEGPDIEKIETTLKVAAVSVSTSPFTQLKINRYVKWGIAALIAVLLFTVSFQFGKQSFLNDPCFRQMVERLDMYIAVSDDGFELLYQLADKRVFLPPLPEDSPPIDPLGYTPITRSLWKYNAFTRPVTKDQDESNKEELYQVFYKNIQKFHNLSREKADQVRKLHWDIQNVPRSLELTLTLQNYYHWLKSLQSYEKNALKRSQPIEGKVADIIKLKKFLDEQQADDETLIPSEIIGIEDRKCLAEALAKLPPWEQERLLNNDPLKIINELKQSFR